MYSEMELIEQGKLGNSEAINALVQMHSGVLYNMVTRTSLPHKAAACHADLFSNRFEVVYNACLKYDSTRSKFNTLVGNEMRWSCLRQINKLVNKDENNYEAGDLTILKDNNFKFEDHKDNIEEYLDFIEDGQIRKVMELRFCNHLTWQQIGKAMNFTHTYAGMLAQQGYSIIKRQLNKKVLT